MITRDEAFELLKKYNKDPFHIQHSLTVEAVMKWYANELGYGDEAEYWGIVGLLHDIDFELYPEEHCLKAPELLRDGGVSDDIIHSVCSHGYGITVGCGQTIDVEPTHEMEKVLFAADELTGLIWAAALMRPSKSTKDMELRSLKKKYKSKGFAAGCSREVIERGAQQLNWELDKLLTMTLQAMAENEDLINSAMAMENSAEPAASQNPSGQEEDKTLSKQDLLDLIDKAGKGSIEAAEAIAEGYFKGSFEGKKNPEKARKWASYAAKHGSGKAAKILAALD